MKNSFYMMLGAAAGIGLYVGINNMSENMYKNQYVTRKFQNLSHQ